MTKVRTLKEAREITKNSLSLHIYPTKGRVYKYAVMTYIEWMNWK